MAMQYVSIRTGWSVVVALGTLIAHTAVLLVFQLGQPRILFAMARTDFSRLVREGAPEVSNAPHVATILTGVLVAWRPPWPTSTMVDLTNTNSLRVHPRVPRHHVFFQDPHRDGHFGSRSARAPSRPRLIACVYLIFYLPPSS